MIITLFLQFITSFVAMIFTIVPNAHIAQIPIAGPYISEYLTMAVQYYNLGASILPYIAIVKDMLVYVIIPFELTILILRFFLGSRTPIN